MKILLVDTLTEHGHINFDKFYITLLSCNNEVTFLSPVKFIDNILPSKRIFLPTNFFGLKIEKLPFRIAQLLYLRYVKAYINAGDYSCVIFLSYETISFSIISWFLRKKVYIINHNNIDQLFDSKIKRIFFSLISKKTVKHIVFEKYIHDFLINSFSIFSIINPHPIYRKLDYNISKNIKNIFAPSSTNENNIIDDLIKFVSTNNAYSLVIKSKKTYKCNRIESDIFFKDYDKRMQNADIIFIPTLFKYRVSGVLYEALSCNRPVVGLSSIMLVNFQKRYPNIIFCIEKIEDIKHIKLNISGMKQDFINFRREHDSGFILENFSIKLK